MSDNNSPAKGMEALKREATISGAGSAQEGRMLWIKMSNEETIPIFKEVRSKPFVYYGSDNKYPEKLLALFRECSDHRAIVLGKTRFIFGNGLDFSEAGVSSQLFNQANAQESLEDVVSKAVLDWEIFRGFYIRVKWNRMGQAARFYHVPFHHVRANDQGTRFWVCKKWGDRKAEEKAEELSGLEYSDRIEDAIWYFSAYDPESEIYPLPEYIAAVRHMEIDTHIAQFHRSNVLSGWSAGSMVVLKRGEPTEGDKREIKGKLKGAATGSENGGEVLVYFAEEGEQTPEVIPLRSNDLDKQYLPLGDTIQQKIFTAHNITNGMLFGIKTPGQLGGRKELLDSFELLDQTYIEPNQQAILQGFERMLQLSGIQVQELKFKKSNPITRDIIELYDKGLVEKAKAQEVLGLDIVEAPKESEAEGLQKALGSLSPLLATKVLEKLTDEEVRSLGGLGPIQQDPAIPPAPEAGGELKLWAGSLPGSPEIRIRPIAAKTKEEAEKILEDVGFGAVSLSDQPLEGLELSEEDISRWNDEKDLAVFAEFGEAADQFEEIQEADPLKFAAELSEKQVKTLGIFKENPKASLTEISKVLWIDIQEASKLVTDLIKKKLVAPASSGGGITITPTGTAELDQRGGGSLLITTKWKYSGPVDQKNRPFCAALMSLGRVYDREDIEALSVRLGYDVWKRRGGWYHVPGTLLNIPHCRHEWKQIIVKRRNAE